MTSTLMNKSLVARSAAILTTSEVAAATLNLNAGRGTVSVQLAFTIGSLTNVIVKAYVSDDGSTWVPVYINGVQFTETITASGTRAYMLNGLGGWRFFRVSLTGTGTVTSSSATVTYRYLRRD